MIIIKQTFISRQDLTSNPRVLYIFGDNLQRIGMGGQAKEMRGEPNAFGIATKRRVSHGSPQDYFHDEDPDVISIIDDEFLGLDLLIVEENPAAIVIPLNGIGTGLAKLQEFAPKALQYINHKLGKL